MLLPEFFARIPTITLRDPLAELLGAAEGGLIEYAFADAVKLAGHSCPTVAGAWLMSVRALRALYGDEIPVRGNIAVALHENLDSGVAGVIASVATLLTGAAGDGGFKGLGGRHARRGLLRFGAAEVAGMRFRRLDTGAAVDCVFRPQLVPARSHARGIVAWHCQRHGQRGRDQALWPTLAGSRPTPADRSWRRPGHRRNPACAKQPALTPAPAW